jgi:thiamine pyrophosphokinase
MKSKRCIILANGSAPDRDLIDSFIMSGFTTLICADGGADTAYNLGLLPDYIIGDLDSASPKVLLKFSECSKIIKYRRQNDTDVEKCIKFASKKGFTHAVLLGATGERLDHSFCNMGIIVKYRKLMKLYLANDESILESIEGINNFKSVKGEVVSIYGLDDKTLITTKGLLYPVKNKTLQFGVRESTSNVCTSEKFMIKSDEGVALLVRSVNRVISSGFITNN